MVVGPAGAGKTQLIECLAAALTELGTKHVTWRMNPKAITVPQMFGRLDAATGGWWWGLMGAEGGGEADLVEGGLVGAGGLEALSGRYRRRELARRLVAAATLPATLFSFWSSKAPTSPLTSCLHGLLLESV